VIGKAKNNKPIDDWYMFFDHEIFQIILEKITELSVKYGKTATFVSYLE
jgi:hypothetical protein